MLAEIVLSVEMKLVVTAVIVAMTAVLFMIGKSTSGVLTRAWSLLIGKRDGEKPLTIRGSDLPAPEGTKEYLKGLSDACPGAPEKFLWNQALSSVTTAKCQREYIDVLRGQSAPKSLTQTEAT